MNWQIGDVAIFRAEALLDEAGLNGQIVELLEHIGYAEFDGDIKIENAWRVSSGSIPEYVDEDSLYPLPPPNEVTTWDECEFQPKELIGVES